MSKEKEIVSDLAEGKAMSPVVDVHEFELSAKELAAMLDGGESGSQISPEKIKLAKDNGLVIIYVNKVEELIFSGNINENYENQFLSDLQDLYVDISGLVINECSDFFCCHFRDKIDLLDKNKKANRLKLTWGGQGQVYEISSSFTSYSFIFKIREEFYCEGIVFSVKDLEGEDLPSAKLVSELKECTDFQAIEIEKLKTKLSESEGLHSILSENGLATQSKLDDLGLENQTLKADLSESKILADDRQNQILKLEKVNQGLGRIYSDNMAVYTGKLQKEYDNLIDSGAKDAVIAKDRIDELTNTIHDLNSQLNEFGAMP